MALMDLRCDIDFEPQFDGGTVEIIVGAEKRSFFLHEKLICLRSGFFEAAFKKGWKEGQAHHLSLPEDDSSTFGCYVQWLYTGKIAAMWSKEKADKCRTGFAILGQMYALGEKLIDNTFQDRVIDALVAGTRDKYPDETGATLTSWFPTKSTVDSIYLTTPKGSPVRRFLIDLHVTNGQPKWIDTEDIENNNHEFLVDLAAALLEKRVLPTRVEKEYIELSEGSPCSYHKHDNDKPCGK